MWWRVLTFCVLVCVILFIVLSAIHGRPAIHLFFHRCCEEDIENDQVIFENFGNNFLRERLVGDDNIFVADNDSFVSSDEVEEVISLMREKLNVHDPKSRINLSFIEILPVIGERNSIDSVDVTTERIEEKGNEGKVKEISDFTGSKEVEAKVEVEVNSTVGKSDKSNSEKVTTETFDLSALVDEISDLEEAIAIESGSSNKDVLSELDSDESIEVTTKSNKGKEMIHFKDSDIIK